jgi:hypothetical protein
MGGGAAPTDAGPALQVIVLVSLFYFRIIFPFVFAVEPDEERAVSRYDDGAEVRLGRTSRYVKPLRPGATNILLGSYSRHHQVKHG